MRLFVLNQFRESNEFGDFFIKLVDFMQSITEAIINIWEWMTTEININFKVKLFNINYSFSFEPIQILGTILVVLLVLLLIKKFIPIA